MPRCGKLQIRLPYRKCSILYALILVLNVSLCAFLYLEMTSQTSQQPHSCSCPSIVTCGATPTQGEARSGNTSVKHYLLVVMVLSSLKGKERRDTIRQTWMEGYKEKKPSVLVRFALGIEGLTTSELREVKAEQEVNQDLLLLPNLKESYSNLTRKVLTSFIALDSQFNFSYLLKCDDDTFVMLDTVTTELAQRTSRRSFYWGFFDGRAHVKRQGKWADKTWFLCDRYLPYALGGGYVLSHDLVGRIVKNSDGLVFYNSEDVSVGVWLSPYDAERRHDIRFNTEFVSRGCRNLYIVSHKQSIEDMLTKQKTLRSKGVQCEKEYQTRMSYVYNWTADPTKCCERRRDVM